MERTDRWGRIYRRRQAEYVTAIPSLLDYFGFVYHFPGLLGGPNTYYRAKKSPCSQKFFDCMRDLILAVHNAKKEAA